MNSLLNFDQVFALTQQTINTQFQLLFLNGTISKQMNVTPFPNSAVGIQASLKTPTVSVSLGDGNVNPQQVRFNINIDSGNATYYSPTGQLIHEDVSGFTIALLVNLTELPVTPSYNGIKVSDEVKSATAPFLNQNLYTVTAILLDLDNVNYSTATIYNPDGSRNTSSTLTTLLSAIIQELIKDGNPYLLSVNPKINTVTNTGLQGFQPTSVLYNTHLYNNTDADSQLSTYNMCIMNEQHTAPFTRVTLPKFPDNLVSSGVAGRLYISNAQFASVYIENQVLPILKSAMGSQANFTRTGNTWTYDFTSNQNDKNDGHGPVVGSDSGILDIYGNLQIENQCKLTFDPTKSTSNQVVLNGSGFFYVRTDFYERPFNIWAHDAYFTVKKSFTFTIILEAGADGKITINFTSATSAAQTDSWENIAVKFADLFNGGLQSSLDKANNAFTNFENGRFDSFTTNAAAAFNVLENVVILPGASSYFFKNATTNTEGDIIFDLAVRN